MEYNALNTLTYNTERLRLLIPEYGRNVQNMIDYAKKIESREERNLAVQAIIDVMGQLNPHLRDIEDYNHKLWTHLYIMSNFEIDVDCPYEIPKQEKLRERPKVMEYPTNKAKYGHFGYYAEQMIKEAGQIEDEEEKLYLSELYANLLKKNYLTFHTQNVDDSAVASYLGEISEGKLTLKDLNVLKPTNAILRQFGSANLKTNKPKPKAKRRRK